VSESWTTSLERFAERCERAVPGDAQQLVIELLELVECGPSELSRVSTHDARQEVRKLIAADSSDGAALRLVEDFGFVLSAAPESMAIATVAALGGREHSASSPSIAVAICGALAGALIVTATSTEVPGRSARHGRSQYT
jgi:hypothetical protein